MKKPALPTLFHRGAVPGDDTGPRPGPTEPFTPHLPYVNLLPPAVQEVLGLRKLRRRFLTGGAALLVVAAVAYMGQFAAINAATTDLSDAQAETTRLTAQAKKLAPVKAFYDGNTANLKAATEIMASEILYSDVTRGLLAAAPDGVKIVSLNIAAQKKTVQTVGTAPTSDCPGPDPFNPATSIACINVTGHATSRHAVAGLINNLFNDTRFANPFVSSTSINEGGLVTFTATVGLTKDVQTDRYANIEFILKAATK